MIYNLQVNNEIFTRTIKKAGSHENMLLESEPEPSQESMYPIYLTVKLLKN